MTTRIHMQLFTETQTESGEWHADAAQTFKTWDSPVTGRTIPELKQADCTVDQQLYGLLADEVGTSLPWSWWQRGLPPDLSPEIQAVHQEWEEEAYGQNHLTVQELTEKYVELLNDSRPQAKKLQYSLGQMIYSLSIQKNSAPPASRRVVFWFH